MPAAVILDLDGTLVDTVETRVKAWLAVFAEEHIPAEGGQVAALIGSDGKRLAREVADAAGIRLEPGRDEAIDKRSGEIYAALNVDPQPLPGVAVFIGAMNQAGVRWAIATSSRAEQVATSIEALRLARPPIVVDGSQVEHAKPAPDLLLAAAERLQVDPKDCWYVGDATVDMRAARAAGMRPIAVTTGAADSAQLGAAGATLVVTNLSELAALL